MNALFLIAIQGLVWAHLFFHVMESRYKMERLLVDNLIRGQQRKLRAQEKRQTAVKSAVWDDFILIYCYSYNKI